MKRLGIELFVIKRRSLPPFKPGNQLPDKLFHRAQGLLAAFLMNYQLVQLQLNPAGQVICRIPAVKKAVAVHDTFADRIFPVACFIYGLKCNLCFYAGEVEKAMVKLPYIHEGGTVDKKALNNPALLQTVPPWFIDFNQIAGRAATGLFGGKK